MANRFLPSSMMKVLTDFRDDNPECIIRNLLEGKVPGTWLLLQSLFPHPSAVRTGMPIQCEFEIKPDSRAFTGGVRILVEAVFNLGPTIMVLGKRQTKENVTAGFTVPDWIGLQYDLASRKGVIIMYRSLWDRNYGETESKMV